MPFCGEFSSNKTFCSNPDTCTLIMLIWITCIRLIDVSFSVFPKFGQTIYHDYMKLYIFPASIYMSSMYKFYSTNFKMYSDNEFNNILFKYRYITAHKE